MTQLALPARTSSIGPARRWVIDSLRRDHLVDAALADRITLVVSELVTNAVQAVPDESFTISVTAQRDSIAVTVANRGRIAELPRRASAVVPELPDGRLPTRGRGLGIVGEVADAVAVVENQSGDATTLEVTATFAR